MATWPLTFTQRYRYHTNKNGIEIPIIIHLGVRKVSLMAKPDTGAEYCLFQREMGERLGLKVETGVPITLDSLGGPLEAFGHEVTLQTFDLTFQSFVYFAKYHGMPRNLLGSVGWFRNVKFAVIDYDETIYLAPYDE